MAQVQRKPGSGPAASDNGMKGLLDLFSRSPTPARVTMHVERLLAGWREALDPDAYAERLDTLREKLVDGIALTEEGAADVDPAWFRSGLHAKRGIPWLARFWPLSV